MKTGKIFFYTVRSSEKIIDGWKQNFYEVIQVNQFNNDTDEAERKARTIAAKHNTELAGGSFVESCKPYNFKTHYTVLNCPDNTKIQPYNERDLYIIDLIEYEKNMPFTILTPLKY